MLYVEFSKKQVGDIYIKWCLEKGCYNHVGLIFDCWFTSV